MSGSFVNTFVQGNYFLQNPPLDHNDFIKYCQKLGLMKEVLPPDTKRGMLIQPLLAFSIATTNGVFSSSFPGSDFDARVALTKCINQGQLTSPLYDGVQPVNKLVDEYYSNFQFIQIDKLTNDIGLSQGEISSLIKLSVTAQSAYMPFFKSGGKLVQISGFDEQWSSRRADFDLAKYLENEGLEIASILMWYQKLPELAKPLLGIKRQDNGWLELWKSIAWDKKESLEGDVRRGIEYLQWALMLKMLLQDYRKGEVLDIDEVSNISAEQILDYIPAEMNQKGILLRASRNNFLTDPETGVNYYHDRYRRLNYLANSFRLDYQPRIILFVEGYIEMKVLPILFEGYCGLPGTYGIEIKSLAGVDNLKSTRGDLLRLEELIKDIHRTLNQKVVTKDQKKELTKLVKRFERVEIITSNWETFINFNLEKWQAIPFFLADNEGQLQHVLQTAKVLKYHDQEKDVPVQWQFLWGVTNKQKPWSGDSFELANFSNEEISKCLKDLYDDTVPLSDIQKLRDSHHGLGKLVDTRNEHDPSKKRVKLDINLRLAKNLIDYYSSHTDQPYDRPVFDAIDRIRSIAALNHAPTNILGEIRNRDAILEQIDALDKK